MEQQQKGVWPQQPENMTQRDEEENMEKTQSFSTCSIQTGTGVRRSSADQQRLHVEKFWKNELVAQGNRGDKRKKTEHKENTETLVNCNHTFTAISVQGCQTNIKYAFRLYYPVHIFTKHNTHLILQHFHSTHTTVWVKIHYF